MSLTLFSRRMTAKRGLALLLFSFLQFSATVLTAQEKPAAKIDPNHPLAPALKYVKQSREVMNQIQDYEALFTKRERINGQLITQQMEMRLREKPFSVYLRFKHPSPGREVLYVAGQNNNELIAHEATGFASIIGTISISPTSARAMKENRYPVTMIGISNLLDKIIKQMEVEGQYGEIDVKYYPDAKIGQVECVAIEVSHPVPRRQFRNQLTRIYFEKKSKMLIRLEAYGFPQQAGQPSPLVEEYTYTNIQTNKGLADRHFDRRNPEYQFR